MRLPRHPFVLPAAALSLATFAALPSPLFALCAYTGPEKQQETVKHDGSAFYRCDTNDTWTLVTLPSTAPGGSSGALQYNNAGALAGAAALTYAASGSLLTLSALAAADKPLIVKGAASQNGNLQEWQNSSGTALAYVTSAGVLTGSGAGLTALNAGQLSSGTVAAARLGTGTADSTTYLRGDGTWTTPASQWSNGASSAIYYSAGNVGIGTVAPTNYGANYTTLQVTGKSAGNGGYFVTSTSDNSVKGYFGTMTGQVQLSAATASAITFLTTNTERMRIDASGSVGIGTTSPSAALDVSAGHLTGALKIGADLNASTRTDNTIKRSRIVGAHYDNEASNVGIISGDSTGVHNTIAIGGGSASTTAATDIVLYTAENNSTTAGTERLRVGSTGNVGIGTTTPAVPLEVAGTIRSKPLSGGSYFTSIGVSESDSANYQAYAAGSFKGALQYLGTATGYGTRSGTFELASASGVPLALNSGGVSSAQLYITNAGNVGIGNPSPSVPLHVGTATAGGEIALGATDGTSEGSQIWLEGAGAYDNWIFDLYQHNLRFYTNSANVDQVQVFNNSTGTAGLYVEGNVGIGTTNPGQKLSVAGTIESTSGGIKFPDGTTQTTAASGGGAITCPSGFTKLQSQGRSLGCLQTTSTLTGTIYQAMSDCFTTYGGRLPLADEIYVGFTSYSLSHPTVEWVSCNNGYSWHCPVINTSNQIQSYSHTTTTSYRCFLPAGSL